MRIGTILLRISDTVQMKRRISFIYMKVKYLRIKHKGFKNQFGCICAVTDILSILIKRIAFNPFKIATVSIGIFKIRIGSHGIHTSQQCVLFHGQLYYCGCVGKQNAIHTDKILFDGSFYTKLTDW